MKRTPIILDGDPGHDDAIAWVLACQAPELDIRAAVAVNGNVGLDKTYYNALRILTMLGRTTIPVGRGAAASLNGLVMTAPTIHGESGLDGPKLPEPAQTCGVIDGLQLMIKTLEDAEEPVTIVATGPLTDVAILCSCRPDLKSKIGMISLMGGGIQSGNWTPAAEFNILLDPEAAHMVFHAGVPIVMMPLDTTEKAYVTPNDFERIKALGNPVAQVVYQWLEFFYKFHKGIGYPGAPLHDPCAVGYLLHPEIFQTRDIFVDIERGGRYTRGRTVGDIYDKSHQKPNATVSLGIDRQAFVEMIIEACASYGGNDHE